MRLSSFAFCFGLSLSGMAAPPAHATDYCEDLWYSSNALFDRAGSCFGSPLGQAVFDNSDCLRKSASLSSADQRAIAEIKEKERLEQCKLDTGQRHLSSPELMMRAQLWHLPIRDDTESACLGWLGGVVSLYGGHSQDALITGQIAPGDTIGFSYLPDQGWDFLQVFSPDWSLKSEGWTDRPIAFENCSEAAG